MGILNQSGFIQIIIFLVSGISAWRCLTILIPRSANWQMAAWLGAWFGLCAGLMLFWLTVLYLARSFKNNSFQHLSAIILVAVSLGTLGFMLTSPAGLAYVTVELYAVNAWSPNMFTLIGTWSRDGLDWQVPFRLPENPAVPVKLEIITTGQSNSSNGSTVSLVGATWPSGESLPFDQFEAETGWAYRYLNWKAYHQLPIWESSGEQPAVLRWQGPASGPLTLVFTKHPQAGKVTIHWNDTLTQTLDLYAPELDLAAVTLPVNEPVVWRANLPTSALAEEIRFTVQPDPLKKSPVIFDKISLIGVPGQNLAAAGPELLKILHVSNGDITLTPDYQVQLANSNEETPEITLKDSLAPQLAWSPLLPWLENGLLVLYIAVIGGIMAGCLARLVQPNVLPRAMMALLGVMIALLIGEAGLRLYLPAPQIYYPRPPNIYREYDVLAGVLPGVEGKARYWTNSQGIRGEEILPETTYRILAVGGSSTECLVLDQTEAWPQLVQDALNRTKNQHVWVGNAGQSGRTSRENLLHLKYLLPQYPEINAVIVLMGMNDLSLRLSQDESYNPDYWADPNAEQALIRRAFYWLAKADPFEPYYQQSATWRLVKQIQQSQAQLSTIVEDVNSNEGALARRREQRKSGPLREQLPDLTSALAEYSRNINIMIDVAQAQRVRIILMTQPTMWRTDLSQTEKDLLWFGWGPNRKYFYSIEALVEGISAYNQKLLEVCQQHQVECIDLAETLPKDTTVFYDDVHFNESGARQVAQIVADYLLRHDAVPLTQ